MAARSTEILPNGLPLHRIGLAGTQAVTIVIAFDAGSRTEGPGEHGVAHFLEHLVFRGGHDYADTSAITEAAEQLGAALNAYTSHHLVAFHVTVRSTVAGPAIDLLTDFVARPRLAPEEVERERGVVVQEIARTHDDPARLADHLVDRAAFGDHPLGRAVLGTPESVLGFEREDVVAFRARRWTGERGAAFVVGDVDALGDEAVRERFGRIAPAAPGPAAPPAPAPAARVLVDARPSHQSHLRVAFPARIDVGDPAQRAALTVLGTLIGGSMGSRLFREIREQRGLAYVVGAFDNVYADGATLQLNAGLEPAKAAEAYRRMRAIVEDVAAHGVTDAEVERARTYAAGQLVIACESSGVVARHGVKQAIVFGEPPDHEASIAALDAVAPEHVAAAAATLVLDPTVACVGPHEPEDFQ
jgi:predicted Zn-dependent peptidase